jgi:hypothetical protein
MVLAVAAMVGMFAACVLVVVTGVRILENALSTRRRNVDFADVPAKDGRTKSE